jgi:hypothetical protein
VADDNKNKDPSLVERWLTEQQQWQRTLLTYLDSMVKNDEFLTHLGNAMRGSLLAGKAYPTAPPPNAAEPQTAADDKLDQILFALRQLEGQVQDLKLSVAALESRPKPKPRRTRASTAPKAPSAS